MLTPRGILKKGNTWANTPNLGARQGFNLLRGQDSMGLAANDKLRGYIMNSNQLQEGNQEESKTGTL
jgi:hypothetical protein